MNVRYYYCGLKTLSSLDKIICACIQQEAAAANPYEMDVSVKLGKCSESTRTFFRVSRFLFIILFAHCIFQELLNDVLHTMVEFKRTAHR